MAAELPDDGWARLRSLQPPSESNREDKLCAQCEINVAKKFCTKCKCTPYCSRKCQAAHWKAIHAKACFPDPLISSLASPTAATLPTFRPFTEDEERSEAIFFVMRAGTCASKPADNRDAHCMLIGPADPAFDVTIDEIIESESVAGAAEGQYTRVSSAAAAAMGWPRSGEGGMVVSAAGSGYSSEDATFFRFFWWQPRGGNGERGLLEENRIAHAMVVLEPGRKHTGNFAVAKVQREPAPGGEGSGGGDGGCDGAPRWREVLVPFTKAELVDACCWRWFCGAPTPRGLGGLGSSRLHRENMRRREMQGFLKSQGFEGGAFQNTRFHTGL